MKLNQLIRFLMVCAVPWMTIRCEQLLDALNKLDKPEATAPANTDLGKAGKWTTLVYLDADNNLEGAGVGDVVEMIQRAKAVNGGFGANNKVYVLMDRISGYASGTSNDAVFDANPGDFTATKLFEVLDGGATISTLAVPVGLTAIPTFTAQNTEINMGDGAVLQGFLKWGLEKAAANGSDYVYLDIWDHGAGWGGNAYGGKAVAWDDTNGHDALSLDDIRTAITAAHAASTSGGKTVTILGFDACYMGTVESIFAFKDLVKIVIGSEELEPGNGWDYSKWLPSGDTSPTDLASKVVTSYGNYYALQSGSNVTLSAYDLTKAASLQGAIDSFVGALGSTNPSLITTARGQVQVYNNNLAVDLYHFAQLLNLPESNGVKTAISNMLIKETHTAGGSVKNSFGMSIYFPTSTADYDTTYNNTIIASATRWDEFISGKVSTYQVSTVEPGDATCGAESNDTSAKAKPINAFAGAPCTGYIFTTTDSDFYRFSISDADLPASSGDTGKTLTVSLTNIPSGANFDVYVYAPFYSPSSAIAIGAASSSNGSESFVVTLSNGQVNYTLPDLTAYNGALCDPGSTANILHQYGYCYGQGMIKNGSAHNIYIVVRGKNGSYSQAGKYTLTVSAAGMTIAAPVAND